MIAHLIPFIAWAVITCGLAYYTFKAGLQTAQAAMMAKSRKAGILALLLIFGGIIAALYGISRLDAGLFGGLR